MTILALGGAARPSLRLAVADRLWNLVGAGGGKEGEMGGGMGNMENRGNEGGRGMGREMRGIGMSLGYPTLSTDGVVNVGRFGHLTGFVIGGPLVLP
jgi:hypothetical protein